MRLYVYFGIRGKKNIPTWDCKKKPRAFFTRSMHKMGNVCHLQRRITGLSIRRHHMIPHDACHSLLITNRLLSAPYCLGVSDRITFLCTLFPRRASCSFNLGPNKVRLAVFTVILHWRVQEARSNVNT